jgi:S1-C subfamily serine protease
VSSPVEEQDAASQETSRDGLARGVVAALIALIAVGLVVAVVLVVKDRPKHATQPAGQSSAPAPASGPARSSPPAMDLAAVATYVDPGLVELTIQRPGGAVTGGTGIILTRNGEFLTNDHLVDGALSIMGTVDGGGVTRTLTATVIGHDDRRDLALLRLQGASGLQTPVFGASATVTPGDPVIAVGHAPPGARPVLIPGIVLSLNQRTRPGDPDTTSSLRGLIQMYASIQPEDAGGPVVNRAGQVIGVNVAAPGLKEQSAVPVGYAIPIRTALQAAEDMRQGTTQEE